MRYLPAILLLLPVQVFAGEATVKRGYIYFSAPYAKVIATFRAHERELLSGLRATVVKRKGDLSLVDVRLRADEKSRILLRISRKVDKYGFKREWYSKLEDTDGKITDQWTHISIIDGGDGDTLVNVRLHATIPGIHSRFIKVSLERAMRRIDEKLREYL